MRQNNNDTRPNKRSIARRLYLITVFFLVLTGFGQMPIFKRYYIADIPGLGWLAKFYMTHYLHYLGAIILIALFAYAIVEYLIINRKNYKVSSSGYIRGAILLGLIISGAFLVYRNLSNSNLSPGFIIFLDLFHFGLVICFLMAAFYCVVFRAKGAEIYIHGPLQGSRGRS